jgi:hypothetical protein
MLISWLWRALPCTRKEACLPDLETLRGPRGHGGGGVVDQFDDSLQRTRQMDMVQGVVLTLPADRPGQFRVGGQVADDVEQAPETGT